MGIRAHGFDAVTATRLLVAMGDAESISTWSGIPYHFLKEARRQGFLHGGARLHPAQFRIRRALWNVGALLTTGRAGGYQYTCDFLRRLFATERRATDETELVSHFPLLPPTDARNRVSFYIDATLKQNFEEYGVGVRVARRLQADAMAREREQYARADRVVCMSQWAASSILNDYRVPRSKVSVVRPGANLDEDAVASLPPPPAPSREVLRLGFVGKDWSRKGLPFLIAVAEQVERLRQRVEVVAIGPPPRDLPDHRLLRKTGFVDKARELRRFGTLVGGTHFGCLFSRAEALGISTLEFLRLGVPVVGFDVGGIRDCITPEVGLLVAPEANPVDAARALLEAWESRAYEGLRARAWAARSEVTWAVAVARLEQLWGGR